ncbi:hypothetical protein EDC82_1241 [Dermacoccus sp. SAI-028]|nr:hypothetical protein EDC82_1241 [Dermacoccus sp. SAI-028]
MQRVAVRQLVFTGDVQRRSDLARALGGDPVVTSPEYAEFEMPGGGLLGVHAASDEAPVGSCALQVVVPDLDAAHDVLAAVGGVEVLVHAGAGGATLSFQIDALDDLERPGREAGVEVRSSARPMGAPRSSAPPTGLASG